MTGIWSRDRSPTQKNLIFRRKIENAKIRFFVKIFFRVGASCGHTLLICYCTARVHYRNSIILVIDGHWLAV